MVVGGYCQSAFEFSIDFTTSLRADHTLHLFIQQIFIECYCGPTCDYYSIGATFHSHPEGT